MADHRYYLSVMTLPASETGSLGFQLDTFDADFNISVMPSVTGITSGMSEIDVALTIQTQLNTYLVANGLNYRGTPRFSAEPYAATFRLTRTDHVDCFWSQAQFRLQLLTNTTGATIRLSTAPCLATLSKFYALYASRTGQSSIMTMNGQTLNNSMVLDLIEQTSAEFVEYTRNNIVGSTYLGEWQGVDTKATFTSPVPGLSIDQPLIRRKNLYEMYSIPQYSALAYDWQRHTGRLTFRFNQNYVNAGEPFALDNEIRVTFIAGEFTIPAVIADTLVELAKYGLRMTAGIEELSGGTFKVKFKDAEKDMIRIFRPARRFICKKMR